ncbi:MAG: hypothetical protein E6Q59_10655 [Nitrosomonas sp.]|nr:hypothetical protein [Nitrosomonas sp.]OQW84586.1 MAG: hypothetical protein BVN30_02820 [Proteobacteria bacterium ST_bin16]TXI35622.1 MAG: hypothetical protein E6Q59_10655 [Nitrosomonas sp.]
MDDIRSRILECAGKDLNILLEAKERELIPLFYFIEIIASEAAIRKCKRLKPEDGLAKIKKLFELERERFASYRAVSIQIKYDILNNSLIVRDIGTSCPLNNDPNIKAWCKNIEHIQPYRRISLKINDAISWINSNGIPMPEWLASMSGNIQAEKSIKVTSGVGAIGDLIIECLTSNQYDPLLLPKNANGKPGVKSHIRQQLGLNKNTFDRKWEELLNKKLISYDPE